MSKKYLCVKRVMLLIIMLVIVLCMCNKLVRKHHADKHLEVMNQYLQQEGNLQIRSIPQWYSASLSSYNVKEISNPIYWLVNADGSYIQDSCYYFQFASRSDAKKIWY